MTCRVLLAVPEWSRSTLHAAQKKYWRLEKETKHAFSSGDIVDLVGPNHGSLLHNAHSLLTGGLNVGKGQMEESMIVRARETDVR